MNHSKMPSHIADDKTMKAGIDESKVAQCEKIVNDASLCTFAALYSHNLSYKAVDTSATTEGSGTLTILSDGNGNSAVTSSYNGSDSSYVSLNGITYIKDPASGNWIKYAANSPAPSTNNPADGFNISASNITDGGSISYNKLGAEDCGINSCDKYQIIDASQPGTVQYVWFDYPFYSLKEYYVKNSNGTNDIKFTYQTVSITAPSPVTNRP